MNCPKSHRHLRAEPRLPCPLFLFPALTTVEGLISRAISGLEQDQPTRRVSWGILIAAAQGRITYMRLNRVFSFPLGGLSDGKTLRGSIWRCHSC